MLGRAGSFRTKRRNPMVNIGLEGRLGSVCRAQSGTRTKRSPRRQSGNARSTSTLRHVSGKGPWTRGKKSPIEPRVPTESVTARIPVNADPCDV